MNYLTHCKYRQYIPMVEAVSYMYQTFILGVQGLQ